MSLVPMTIDASVSAITGYDPAIDHEASSKKVIDGIGIETPVLSYIADRFHDPSSWRESVKFKDGQSPTVFVIGVIPPAELNRIEDEFDVGGNTRQRHWRAFLHGVRDIENGPTCAIEKDGRSVQSVPKVTVSGIEYVDPKWLAQTFVRGLRHVALDVGATVYAWNQLQGNDIKN